MAFQQAVRRWAIPEALPIVGAVGLVAAFSAYTGTKFLTGNPDISFRKQPNPQLQYEGGFGLAPTRMIAKAAQERNHFRIFDF